jgi:hypothetical protein
LLGSFEAVQVSPFRRAPTFRLADGTLMAIKSGEEPAGSPTTQVVLLVEARIMLPAGAASYRARGRIEQILCLVSEVGLDRTPTPLPPIGIGVGVPLPELPVDPVLERDSLTIEARDQLDRARRALPSHPVLRIRGTYRAEYCKDPRAERRLLAIEFADGGHFRLDPVSQEDAVRPLSEIVAFDGRFVELVIAPSTLVWSLVSLRAL